MGLLTRKWAFVSAAAIAVLLLLFVMLPHTVNGAATALDQQTPPSPAALRSLARDAEKIARSSRITIEAMAMMFVIPAFNISAPRDGMFEKKAEKFIQLLKRLAPDESAAAYKAAQAVVKASQHKARAFDALAKKLCHEADRLEWGQKKKNYSASAFFCAQISKNSSLQSHR